MMNFNMPVKLYTGRGCIAAHKDDIARFGKKCLIVTGAASAKKSGALDDVRSVLSELGISYEVFDGISQNPTVESCRLAGVRASEFGADFIFGIGGGSPLDASKAVAVFASNPGMDEDGLYSMNWPVNPVPVVLAGTTSGTGSEVTNVAVLTDSKHRKHSIHAAKTFAALSFGDPKYTYGIPRSITLSTGVDALAHCTESYFNKKANTLSRSFAISGINLIKTPLAKCARGEELSEEDREELYEGSIFGGLAISITGTCFPHNVGYFLTENHGIPHGFACAVYHPAYLAHCAKAAPEYTAEFEAETGLSLKEYNDLIYAVLPKFDVTLGEDEIEILLPRWVNNSTVNNTPGGMEIGEIKAILTDLFGKKK